MSLIEKIDAEISIRNEIIKNSHGMELDTRATIGGLQIARQIILSEQKEPCGWCKENYRFEFNWIDEDGSTVTTGDHMVIGGIADFCPVCGRPLNQPYME